MHFEAWLIYYSIFLSVFIDTFSYIHIYVHCHIIVGLHMKVLYVIDFSSHEYGLCMHVHQHIRVVLVGCHGNYFNKSVFPFDRL